MQRHPPQLPLTFSRAATLKRRAALISFMASLTMAAGSMSVTKAWMMTNPYAVMLLVSSSLIDPAIS